MQKKTILTILVILLILCILRVGVIADATVSVTPGALPKTNATFVVTYAGTVSSITFTAPDGRTLTGASDGAGTASVYLGEAPSGTYRLTLTGEFSTFSVSITGTVTAVPTPTPTHTPIPTPIPPVESTAQPTVTPFSTLTPIPTPTPYPTSTPISLQIVTPKPTPTPEQEPEPTATSSMPSSTSPDKETKPSNSNPETSMVGMGVAKGVNATATPTPATTSIPTKESKESGLMLIPGLAITVGQTKEMGIVLYMVSAVFGTLLGFAGGYILRDRRMKRERRQEAYGQEIQFDDNGRQIL